MKQKIAAAVLVVGLMFAGTGVSQGATIATKASPTCQGTSYFWSPWIFWGIHGWNCSVRWW